MPDSLTDALQSLPHGPEFRFIDRIAALAPGQSATGEYKVRGDEPFLAGHFPGDPLFPGVLLIEAGAQLAGVIVQSTPNAPPSRRLRLTAVRSIKILGPVRPEETITIRAHLLQQLANLAQFEICALVNGALVLEGQVTLSAH